MDKYFEFKDIKGYYQDVGSGEVIVLAHGFGFDGSLWDEIKSGLAQHFRLIIPDFPGYGQSETTKEVVTVEWLAAYVKAILEKEGIPKATYVGHSMGGYVGLAFAELYPASVEKLVMFHSHPFADGPDKVINRKKAIQFIDKYGAELFVTELYKSLFAPGFAEKNPEVVQLRQRLATKYPKEALISSTEAMIQRKDRSDVLRQLDVPVLFIIGAEDGAIPLEVSLRQTHLPNFAEICLLKEVGHMGMLEKPGKVADVILEFVNLKLS